MQNVSATVINKKFKKIRNQAGFTLLELLVVVAILAIVAGGVLVAYDGLEAKSANGQASHSLAALDSGVRTFTSIRKTAPDNLDSLIAGTPTGGGQVVTALPGTPALIATLSAGELDGKVTSTALTAAQRAALTAAGINQLRYIDLAGNGAGGTLTTLNNAGTALAVGNISLADIPNRIFDIPTVDGAANKNRGRGYSHPLITGSPVAVWNAGVGNINNLKVGAGATDVLIAFGLGNNASIFKADSAAVGGDVNLSQAPNYPNVAKNEYNRYVLLYNVGPAGAELPKAKLQAVVDAKGDFLDEELAEFSGQKS